MPGCQQICGNTNQSVRTRYLPGSWLVVLRILRDRPTWCRSIGGFTAVAHPVCVGGGFVDWARGGTRADTTRGLLAENNSILGGDIKLEASVELRSTVLREVLAADWILALYGDAGNVWFGPRNPGDDAGHFRFSSFYKEIGVGTGFGLRLAWDYLILRLDLAYRVYDPALQGAFRDNAFKESRLHFGIGHTF